MAPLVHTEGSKAKFHAARYLATWMVIALSFFLLIGGSPAHGGDPEVIEVRSSHVEQLPYDCGGDLPHASVCCPGIVVPVAPVLMAPAYSNRVFPIGRLKSGRSLAIIDNTTRPPIRS